MIGIGLSSDVRGAYGRQPFLVKLGSLAVFSAFVLFFSFMPFAIGVAVVAGVGQPASSWKGTAGAFGFLAAFALLGSWLISMFLDWICGRRIAWRVKAFFLAAAAAVSMAVASIAVILHIWEQTFIVAGAIFLICLVASSILTTVGQALRRVG